MRGTGALDHRFCQSTLLAKPQIASGAQIIERMRAEEFPVDALRRRFIGDRFRAVLTKLGDLAMIVGARPGAALAIEPGFLVSVQQRFESTGDAHFADGETRRLIHRW